MADEKLRRKAERFLWGLLGRRVMSAEDPDAKNVHVLFGIGEVTKRCTACCVPRQEWRAGNGWVDLLIKKNGHFVAGHDGKAITKRHFGLVMWYRKDDDE